jgi:DNA-binding transcriptional regulator YhcF (GntR family)
MAPPCEAKLIPTLGCQLPARKCHFAMERVPFCEEAQHMAKHPPSLRMPSIALERFSGPLHRRLCLALSQQILSSHFQNGDRLPSTRALAKALGISRNTVVSAYDKLAEDGYTISKVGSGTHVALTLTRISRPATKPAEGTKGGLSLAGVLQRSHYPVRRATFQDRDGNALYLYAAV